MNKESFYFPHDYDAQNDPKLQALVSTFKAQGYGIYWAIIEMLHKEESHQLPLKEYVYIAIAKQMLTNAKQVEAIINYAIKECELFIENDGYFHSKRVLLNFKKREEISEIRSIAGRKGAIAKQSLANVSKGKERKGKEKKEELKKEERASLFTQNVYYTNGYLKEDLEAFTEYWTESGENQPKMRFEKEKVFDIKRRLKTWIKNKERFKKDAESKGSIKSRLDYKFDADKSAKRFEDIKKLFGEGDKRP